MCFMSRTKIQEWEEILLNYSHTSEKTRKMKKLARRFGIPEHLRAKVFY